MGNKTNLSLLDGKIGTNIDLLTYAINLGYYGPTDMSDPNVVISIKEFVSHETRMEVIEVNGKYYLEEVF